MSVHFLEDFLSKNLIFLVGPRCNRSEVAHCHLKGFGITGNGTYGKVDALVAKNFGTFLLKNFHTRHFHLIWRGVFNDLSAKVGAMDRAQVLLIGLAVGVILRQKAEYSWSKPPKHNEHAEGRTSEKIN